MRMVDLIQKKRDGYALSKAEIEFMVNGYTTGKIPDYQMSAMLMAIYFQGMNEEETLQLTLCMRDSGETLDLSAICGKKVDKHSTGGVGDKTSIALMPMAAACGLKIAKMSGRGLGHTGGTIDKLESFPGFSTALTGDQFIQNVNQIGVAIMGQTKELAPADKLLYALRDVTGTVENISLIASSIMSKKLAAGADAIVLDVTCGSGAFMKTKEEAVQLAEEMVKIGRNARKNTVAVISNMDEPLGYAIGNILEVQEAIETLKGHGPKDFEEVCYCLGSYMLLAGGIAATREQAIELLKQSITSGKALDKLAELVKAQGGDPSYVYHPEKLQKAKKVVPFCATSSGYVQHIHAEKAGISAMLLGGGRATKEDQITMSVGLILCKKVGDPVTEGEPLAYIHAEDDARLASCMEVLKDTFRICKEEVSKSPGILGVIDS